MTEWIETAAGCQKNQSQAGEEAPEMAQKQGSHGMN
jgi:hypothetical protein